MKTLAMAKAMVKRVASFKARIGIFQHLLLDGTTKI